MGDSIGLFGVSGAQSDGVRPLKISIHFIVARQSVAGTERDKCDQSETRHISDPFN
jgi:hypothetical protein